MQYSVNTIRQTFLDFFAAKGHTIVPSSPLIPHNDPTLMFTNAGMVQFKNAFTGAETYDYTRAASSQKCVRAGGKHNDLDNVGYTARHHTFFEMLGNFSFGDYFKQEAITWSWEFLTETLGFPADKLYITIYHDDDDAFNIWHKDVGLAKDRIIRIATSDNFWAMGETGPCGPCSEIFFDHGSDIPGGLPGTPEEDGDRYIEIWNLVFTQFDKQENGDKLPLPNPCIDTGMGLERMAAVLQNVHDNYDTDLFQHLIDASKDFTNNDDPAHITSHRVIADHLRSSAFLLADGVMPSNEGRGYVLRRIMRRAMRHVHQLGCKDPVMFKLVPALIEQMGQAYPELIRAQALISETLKSEEERFQETLGRGLKLLGSESEHLKAGDKLAGDVAFKLYDTYGFPLDLTKDILRGKSMDVDEAGFDAAMAEQKARAKAAWVGSGATATSELWFNLKDSVGSTEFLGYDTSSAQGQITAIIKDGKQVNTANEGDEIALLMNQTPFYGESGGQAGDTGVITTEGGAIIHITNTTKEVETLIIHHGKISKGSVSTQEVATATIDEERRTSIRSNHSATHLLHAVLRQTLGDHVTQKGSLVEADRFRFDFSHAKAVTPEELLIIEQKINALVRQNSDVGTHLMEPEEAIEKGAMALFGEKYGDEVRVVNMGLEDGGDYSVELCGGTHVKRTGDIGLFKILSEGAIAAGIRRIEAVTGQAAFDHITQQEQQLQAIAATLKIKPEESNARIQSLLDERKALEKELSEARKQAAMGGGGAETATKDINGVAFLGKHFPNMPPKDLRGIADELKQQVSTGVIVITSDFDGKASLVVSVTDDLTGKFSAVDLVRIGAEKVGGKGGGGKPNLAQAGGPEGNKVNDAIEAIQAQLG